jgi:hypothetical protein
MPIMAHHRVCSDPFLSLYSLLQYMSAVQMQRMVEEEDVIRLSSVTMSPLAIGC